VSKNLRSILVILGAVIVVFFIVQRIVLPTPEIVPLDYNAFSQKLLANQVQTFDAVGTDEAIDVSLALVPEPSRIVSIAAFHRADTGIRLIGNGPGADPGTEIRANAWRQLLPLAATGRLTLLPAKTYPLTEAALAHTLLSQGHPNGKLALLPA